MSVVLPVRDEADNVVGCLRSLLAQDILHLSVIVVDDESSDGTLDLARSVAERDERVVVLEGRPLPSGWIGKSWANDQGARLAEGDWLLFTDADVRLEPEAVSKALVLAEDSHADLLTLVPHLECEGFWENLLQPAFAALIGILRPGFIVNARWNTVAVANGQFILIRRSVYDAVGGHAGVRDSIVDDVALAAEVKSHGYRLIVAKGSEVMSVRMYDGLVELWAGWRKSLYPASGGTPTVAALFLGFLFVSSILPLIAVTGWPDRRLRAPAAVVLALAVVVRAWGNRVVRASPHSALLHPMAALVIGAIYVDSMVRHHGGSGQVWKGRAYTGLGSGSVRASTASSSASQATE